MNEAEVVDIIDFATDLSPLEQQLFLKLLKCGESQIQVITWNREKFQYQVITQTPTGDQTYIFPVGEGMPVLKTS